MKNQKITPDCTHCTGNCCKRPIGGNPGSAVYAMGMIGAAAYYFPQLTSSHFFLTIAKIIFWPAFLVYRTLSQLGM